VLTGRRIGIYEIQQPLGAGGMGEVYRARDPKLGRDVAIKLLPAHLTADPDRLARVEREARTLALLNHPHIGAIYGLEDADGVRALILELIDGETLADALAGGPLPLKRALTVAGQMADALDHAHRRGVVHRDLKPSNIMLTKAGAKLLDFGLAKWAQPLILAESTLTATRSADPRNLTREGTILGTLRYMAPEQLEGREADARADIFAFGAVLHEMVTGRKAFEGPSEASLIAAILTAQPAAPSTILPSIPARLDRVVQKCLDKDPDNRWQSARDLADELSWIASEIGQPVPIAQRTRATGLRMAAFAALAAAGTAGWTGWSLARARQTATPGAITRFVVQPPEGIVPNFFDISPDGSLVAYIGMDRGQRRLFLRRMDQFEAVPLQGTEGASDPFFSSDGQWVGFFADHRILKVDVRTGAAPIVLSTGVGAFGSWSSDGTIVFANVGTGVRRMSAEGGEPREITTVRKPAEYDHHSPQLLPGGAALLLTVHQGVERFSIAVESLASGQRQIIIESAFAGRYLPSGHIVFASGSTIRAVPFDVRRLAVTGPPITLVEHVATVPNDGIGGFRVSATGSLVYAPERPIAGRTLTWIDRSGAETPLPISPRGFTSARVSPDGTRLAFAAADGDREDIWTYDIATQALHRATFEDSNRVPLWSKDGKRIVYETLRRGAHSLNWQPADGSGAPDLLRSSANRLHPGAWTPDGRALLYVESPPNDRGDILRMRLDGDRTPEPVIQKRGEGFYDYPSFSPDGHWLSYTSDTSGHAEVYVQPYPDPGPPRQVSVDGGHVGQWARDGRELFIRNAGQIFAVPVTIANGFSAGRPVRLFESRYVAERLTGIPYDLAADGRFLMIKRSEHEQSPPRLNVVLNWTDELTRRVPSSK
jgi:Tol biopolymer transport system component